jgi:hypothetical protein
MTEQNRQTTKQMSSENENTHERNPTTSVMGFKTDHIEPTTKNTKYCMSKKHNK